MTLGIQNGGIEVTVAPRGSIRRAMVLAAGRGVRMRPLTETTPKPLIPVRGMPLIDRILDRLAAAGVEVATVNVFHLREMLESHLVARESGPRLVLSPEAELLETGGGVAQALTVPDSGLAQGAFYVVNGDVLWLDGLEPALARLCDRWDPDEMDGLLLLNRTVSAKGYDGTGDFAMDPIGKLRRRREWEVAPFMFTGIQILHPRLFDGEPIARYSLNRLYDKAMEAERLFGVLHDGLIWHVGTPDGLAVAEADLGTPYPETSFF